MEEEVVEGVLEETMSEKEASVLARATLEEAVEAVEEVEVPVVEAVLQEEAEVALATEPKAKVGTALVNFPILTASRFLRPGHGPSLRRRRPRVQLPQRRCRRRRRSR